MPVLYGLFLLLTFGGVREQLVSSIASAMISAGVSSWTLSIMPFILLVTQIKVQVQVIQGNFVLHRVFCFKVSVETLGATALQPIHMKAVFSVVSPPFVFDVCLPLNPFNTYI